MSCLPDRTLKILQCAVSNENHIVKEPVSLPCGHSACKKCVYPFCLFHETKCKECGSSSKIDFQDFKNSLAVDMIFEENVSKLFILLEEKFKKSLAEMKGKFELILKH